jgi:cyclophilin family peptidyl-prolyl cis-trans isomerase
MAAYGLDDFDGAVRQLEAAMKDANTLPNTLRTEADALLLAARERRAKWDDERARRSSAERDNLPHVRLVTSKGEILLELFEDDAPNTVANFISLAESKIYDGTKFHRVVPNFMVQGGDPNSRDNDPANDGKGGPGYAIKDELPAGKYRLHYRGSLSMANQGPDTNGSQFFLTHRPTEHLDGRHTVFGRVLSGMDVVDRIRPGDTLQEAVVVRRRDHPYRPVIEK